MIDLFSQLDARKVLDRGKKGAFETIAGES
jgi:hypothetical protein